MTELSYNMADLIAPCCDYNQRWELRNGARLRADPDHLLRCGLDRVHARGQALWRPPVVVWVGRIDPLKDLFTLLRAAAVVHQSRPDIQFRLFGSASATNEAYYEKCLALRAELGLEETVTFAGFRSNTVSAFNEGDIVVLSSVSEALPFSILEAMLCEKPVVATAVGGVPEEVAGCGYAVEPRNPDEMAQAILTLMNNPELSRTLGHNAREKAVQEYSVRQSGLTHLASYERLISRKSNPSLPAAVVEPAEQAADGQPKDRPLWLTIREMVITGRSTWSRSGPWWSGRILLGLRLTVPACRCH